MAVSLPSRYNAGWPPNAARQMGHLQQGAFKRHARMGNAVMNDTAGLTIRDIFHFRYGICQMVYFAPAGCWIGLNEKKQSLWAPDRKGHPDMDRVRKPHYLYQEQIPYLEILNHHYQPDCMVLSMKGEEEDSLA